jgi:hypothetical protein
VGHLAKLTLDFKRYIPEDVAKCSWVRNPFDSDVQDLDDDISSIAGFQEQLIEIQSDETQRYNSEKQTESLSAFWIKVKKNSIWGNEALKVLLSFENTFP